MTNTNNLVQSLTNTGELGLDGLLSLLEANNITRRQGRRLKGDNKSNLLAGTENTDTLSGNGGRDILLGKVGNDTLSGGNGSDLLFGGDGDDTLAGGNNNDILFGNVGIDTIDGGNGNDMLDGGAGADILTGGNGDDMLVGGVGVDTLTGGAGRDRFVYSGNVFANGPVAPAGTTGINALNLPDGLADYTIGEDQFMLDSVDLGIDTINFQKGTSAQLADGNVIVLTDPFPAAGAAARAIANNNSVTAKEGVFVYFNTTLQKTRLVYSQDLGSGGNISVLANLNNQLGQSGQTNIVNFSAADFSLG